jgi:serine protease Do
MTFGAASCSGQKAISAYEIAVKNGFKGTEAEWLASLKGADGNDGEDITVEDLYEAAKKEGFDGSLLDFIQSLGVEADIKENNDMEMIANNVSSVVSVCCGFSKVTTSGGLFGGQQKTEYYISAGAGVIIDLDKESGNALVVTNYHVVYDMESREKISNMIYLYGYGDLLRFNSEPKGEKGDGFEARYVGGAMNYDIALLRVEGKVDSLKNKTEAKMGDSNTVSLGEKVFAIGNPKGDGHAVTSGIISVDSEYIQMTSLAGNGSLEFRVIRTDAPINGGNSGCGLFNAKGELIGIVNAKHSSTGVDNIGYALPISQIKNLCDNIMDNGGETNKGVVKRALLGVTVSATSSSGMLDENGKLQIVETFSVAEAAHAGKAAYQKFNVGDTFLTMQINDGEKYPLTRLFQVNDYLLTVRLGDKVHFEIRNANGNIETVTVDFDEESYFTIYE